MGEALQGFGARTARLLCGYNSVEGRKESAVLVSQLCHQDKPDRCLHSVRLLPTCMRPTSARESSRLKQPATNPTWSCMQLAMQCFFVAKVTVDGPGKLAVMPGTLAKWYKEMGAEVLLMGKPAPVIYEAALQQLGLEASQVLAIGDSLEHDIAG